ncbi:hypothetical protein NUU61_000962 [Penicillium alfredii]|uniref:Protein kinase domain-containing protein n=1 Tax=Penicillium alfredii TaxID=1506179 RepID=A0A9W9GB35_9EURO|nr:uncharacterized protein NUU61_000962 [Penicillium alfredii]KAJ5115203.1 hypothetical protein NUU61_000962 [Penicillium alfredii]
MLSGSSRTVVFTVPRKPAEFSPPGTPGVIKKFMKEIEKELPPDMSQPSDPGSYPVGHRIKKLVYNFKSQCNGRDQTVELNSKRIASGEFYKDYIGMIKAPGASIPVRARIADKQGIRFVQGARLQEMTGSSGVEEVVDYFYRPKKKEGIVLYSWDPEIRDWLHYIDGFLQTYQNYDTYITLLGTVETMDEKGIYHLDIQPNYKHKAAHVGSLFYAPQEIVWGEKTWKHIDVVMFELGMLAVSLVTKMFERTNQNIWVELIQQRHVSKDAAEEILIKHDINTILASQLSKVLCSSNRLGIERFRTEMEGMGFSGWHFRPRSSRKRED